MYGWRGKIGMLVPSVNTVAEPEFNRMAPEGVAFYASRMLNYSTDEDDARAMTNHAERATSELARARVDVISFVCTASSFVGGEEWERNLKAKIETVGGVPAVTTSGAVVEAMQALGLKRVVMFTPYPSALNAAEVRFLKSKGIEVLAEAGLNIKDPYEIGLVRPEQVYRNAKELLVPEADGIFASCTNLRTIDIAEKIEFDTGKPFVSSNLATFWASLRVAGCHGSICGFGSLLAGHL
jgi:maleate isomerase